MSKKKGAWGSKCMRLLFRKVRKNKKKYPSDFLFGQKRATERNKKDVAIILCRDAGNHAFEKKRQERKSK